VSNLPSWVCPFCYQQLELASPCVADGRPPEAGDCTVCIYCGELCVLADDLTLRRWTAADREALSEMFLRTIAAGIRESIARTEARARREQGDEFN
jgi:hypothetical protein